MKIFVIVLIILLVVVGGFILQTYRAAGEFKSIEPHFTGQVEKISGIIGVEDITIHPHTGFAFLSCDDRRATLKGEPQQGAIYGYDLKSENPLLINLTDEFEQEFHPHGISLFVDEHGEAKLFVVNHRTNGHFIEIFDFQDEKLMHKEYISGKLMHSPNDVLAVGARSFYVTNDHGSVSKAGRTLEEYLRLAKSNVLYYDGSAFKIVAKGILYANGINQSRDAKTIYVAATTGGKIHVYSRDGATNDLQFVHDIKLGTGVDNIELDTAGNIWVAAHPKLLTFVKHAKDPQKLSPSQILKITPS
ncbi:MAG: strictosidine synthase family protein, partial [bacterium]